MAEAPTLPVIVYLAAQADRIYRGLRIVSKLRLQPHRESQATPSDSASETERFDLDWALAVKLTNRIYESII